MSGSFSTEGYSTSGPNRGQHPSRLSLLNPQRSILKNSLATTTTTAKTKPFSTVRDTGVSTIPPLTQNATKELTELERRRSSQLDNFVRKLSFQEMEMTSKRNSFHRNTGFSTIHSLGGTVSASSEENEILDMEKNEIHNKITFKSTANSIRQSLLSLMSARSVSSGNSGAGYSGMSHLSSGTINGRGSFMQNSAVERQRKYSDTDSLERYV